MELPKNTSKDLLSLEHKKPTPTPSFSSSWSSESTLRFCKKDSALLVPKPKIDTSSITKSNVLGKVKDFLGVMAEANKRLQHDARESSSKEYDIEKLTGEEDEYIEMDLVLGVADLHTPEAVAAAEYAIFGPEPEITSAPSGNESDTESSDDDDDSDDTDSDGDGNEKTCSRNKFQESKSGKGNHLSSSQPKKQQKIIELL